MTGETVLVAAATEAEAARVPDGVPLVVTGMGKTAAAAATARALAAYPDPSSVHVVNIGTAGALHDGLTGLFLPGRVLNHDLDAVAVRALGDDPQEWLELGTGDTAFALASGDVFVTDPVVRARLAAQAQLVDMEGYAVAYAARAVGARVTLVKHVSDAADESAWDWPALVAASAVVLGDWLADHVGG
ncbi:nucleosidase [Nocardioides alkalitolerans]|uniref:nucleosidase n=1 Tax=Nocardioides alkalitolerans TaxID=281714 RepID=UPI00041B55DB|nr:nucleosidase [Nocardioides alkalitolerans]